MYLASPIWIKSLTKFNPQIQDFKRVLDLSESRGKTHRFDFFTWLSNLKNLDVSNDSKTVRNMIQTVLKQLIFPKNAQRRGVHDN